MEIKMNFLFLGNWLIELIPLWYLFSALNNHSLLLSLLQWYWDFPRLGRGSFVVERFADWVNEIEWVLEKGRVVKVGLTTEVLDWKSGTPKMVVSIVFGRNLQNLFVDPYSVPDLPIHGLDRRCRVVPTCLVLLTWLGIHWIP